MSRGGKYTVSVSPYAERHSAWWFYAGFRKTHNAGPERPRRFGEFTREVLAELVPPLNP
ncbi:MAG: hypothetical protein ABIF82_15555 [Planctomycetota bacterium]